MTINWKNRISSKKLLILLIIGLMIIISLLKIDNLSLIYKCLNNYKLLPRKDAFSEMYFDNHLDLPTKIEKGKLFSFSFFIHNIEGQEMDYPYTVSLKTGDNIKILSNSTVKVAGSEYRKINVNYLGEENVSSGVLNIELLYKDQNLHFLLSDE